MSSLLYLITVIYSKVSCVVWIYLITFQSTTIKNCDTVLLQDNPVTGRKADVIKAAHLCAEAALRLVKPGNQVTLPPSPLIWPTITITYFLEL